MDLCILENKEVRTTVYDSERGIVPIDSIIQTAWMREHKVECQVAEDIIDGVKIKTYFRGYDPVGVGYVFLTETSNGDAYGAMTWEQAENHHKWTCEHFKRLAEINDIKKAREQRDHKGRTTWLHRKK